MRRSSTLILTRVKSPIAPRQGNTSRPHQIAKSIRAVRDVPAGSDGAGVAGGAQHDFRPFVRAFPRDFGKLPVVADDVRHSHTARAIEDRDPAVAWIPRLDRYPRVQFAVVIDQVTFVVDHEAGVPRHAKRVALHDGEAAPDRILRAGGFQSDDFGPFERAHEFWVGEHGEAVEAIFGEDDHGHLGVGFAGFLHERADMFGGILEVFGRLHGEELGLAEADYDGI